MTGLPSGYNEPESLDNYLNRIELHLKEAETERDYLKIENERLSNLFKSADAAHHMVETMWFEQSTEIATLKARIDGGIRFHAYNNDGLSGTVSFNPRLPNNATLILDDGIELL